MASLLTTKERERLEKVRRMLLIGENPYSTLDSLTLGGKVEHNVVIKEVPLHVRLDRWNNKEDKVIKSGRVVKRFKSIGTSDPTYKGLRCMRCDKPIEQVTSTLGKMLTGYIKRDVPFKAEVLSGVFVDTIKTVYIPKLTKGRVCSECVKHLSQVIIEDSDHM